MSELISGRLLRIYVGESDHHQGRALYQVLVELVREQGLAGATVLRGVEGFGAHSRIHTARILRLAEDLPLVIEVIDVPERIEAFLPVLAEVLPGGLVTVTEVQMADYTRKD